MIRSKITTSLLMVLFFCLTFSVSMYASEKAADKEEPCIVNFINFIRQLEPRWPEDYPEEYLFNTTKNELDQLN